jgi:DNA (cytosine-5)-methyltransferase 1
MGYREDMIPPEYPAPTVDPEHYVSLKEAIGDLIIDDSIKKRVNKRRSKYQLESAAGRTPAVNGKPISVDKPSNTELSKMSDVVIERFSLFKEGETGTILRKRVLTEGIDISDKPALVKLCSESFGMTAKQVIDLFKKAKANDDQIDVLLTKKNIRQRLDGKQPSSTVVTIPDDYISPWEPRMFSVREMARVQSFDDSFEFLGKRTTGGLKRRTEVPQFTQVGNAVPPLLAKAVALEIMKVLNQK